MPHHLIVAHEVTNVGHDRTQLASMAKQARGATGQEHLTVVADRGYFDGEEILECDKAGISALVPKPLTSNSKAEGRFDKRDFVYAVAVRPATTVWWGEHQPAPAPRPQPRGRPRTRVRRDARHQPLSVLDLARALPAASFRTIQWREGTNTALASRFARVRVRAAQGGRARKEEWLLIEWPRGENEPTHYFLSNLPETVSLEELVATVKMRWRIERDYLELKQELGLGHYEGRNWRGFHHHASLCIAAYGFLMLERLSGVKKNSARLQAPALPESFRPRGARSDAAPHPVVDHHRALSSGPRHRATASAMPLLRQTLPADGA